MSHFSRLPDFEKEFAKLSKKYRSLREDIKTFESFIAENPTGLGKNFTIIHSGDNIKIIKARMMCKSLKNRSIRVIYCSHNDMVTFVHIEIYFKGDKENEDGERIKEYLKGI